MITTCTPISAIKQVVLLAAVVALCACRSREDRRSYYIMQGPGRQPVTTMQGAGVVGAPGVVVDELHCIDCTLPELVVRLDDAVAAQGVRVVYRDYAAPLRRDPRELAFHFFHMAPHDILRAVSAATGAAWRVRQDGVLEVSTSSLSWERPVRQEFTVLPEFFDLARQIGRTRDLHDAALHEVFDRLCLPLPPTMQLQVDEANERLYAFGPPAAVEDIQFLLDSLQMVRRKFHVRADLWLLDGLGTVPIEGFSWEAGGLPARMGRAADQKLELFSGERHQWQVQRADVSSDLDLTVTIAPDDWQLVVELGWDVYDRERRSQTRQTLRTMDGGTLLIPIQRPAPAAFPGALALRLDVRDYNDEPVLRQPDEDVELPLQPDLAGVAALGAGQPLDRWPLPTETLVGTLQTLQLAARQQHKLRLPIACILEDPDSPLINRHLPVPRPADLDFAGKSPAEVLAMLMETQDLHGGFRQRFAILAGPTVQVSPHYTRFGHHAPEFRGVGGQAVGRELDTLLQQLEGRSGSRLRSYTLPNRSVIAWHGATGPLLRAEGVASSAWAAPLQEVWHIWTLLVTDPQTVDLLTGTHRPDVARWFTAQAARGEEIPGARMLNEATLGAANGLPVEADWRWADVATRLRVHASASGAGQIGGMVDYVLAEGQHGPETAREHLRSAVSMAPGGSEVLFQDRGGKAPWAVAMTAYHVDAHGRLVWAVDKDEIGPPPARLDPGDVNLPASVTWEKTSVAKAVADLGANDFGVTFSLDEGINAPPALFGRMDFGEFLPDTDLTGRDVGRWQGPDVPPAPGATAIESLITVSLQDATLRDALAVIAAQSGMRYEVAGNQIRLVRDLVQSELIERLYPLSPTAAATWQRLFPNPMAAATFLGCGPGGRAELTPDGTALRVHGPTAAVRRAGEMANALEGPLFTPRALLIDPAQRELSVLPRTAGYGGEARQFADGRLPASVLELGDAAMHPGEVVEAPYSTLRRNWAGQMHTAGMLRAAPAEEGHHQWAPLLVAGPPKKSVMPAAQTGLQRLADQRLETFGVTDATLPACLDALRAACRTAELPPPAANIFAWEPGKGMLPGHSGLPRPTPTLTAAWQDAPVATILDDLTNHFGVDWAVLPRSVVVGERRHMSLQAAAFSIPKAWLGDGDAGALLANSGLLWSHADRWFYDAPTERLHVCATPSFVRALRHVLGQLRGAGWQVTFGGQITGTRINGFRVYTVPAMPAVVETPEWPPLRIELTPLAVPAPDQPWPVRVSWRDPVNNVGSVDVEMVPGEPFERQLGELAEDPVLRMVLESRPIRGRRAN